MNKLLLTLGYAAFIGYLGYSGTANAQSNADYLRDLQANYARINADRARQDAYYQRQEMLDAQRRIAEETQQLRRSSDRSNELQERYNCIASGRSSC
jgi:hypothetical protein